MPQREHLKLQGRPGPQTIAKSKEDRDQDDHHAESLFDRWPQHQRRQQVPNIRWDSISMAATTDGRQETRSKDAASHVNSGGRNLIDRRRPWAHTPNGNQGISSEARLCLRQTRVSASLALLLVPARCAAASARIPHVAKWGSDSGAALTGARVHPGKEGWFYAETRFMGRDCISRSASNTGDSQRSGRYFRLGTRLNKRRIAWCVG